MKWLFSLLTLIAVFSLPLVGCGKDSVGRERPSKTRDLRRQIRALQSEQSALLKEHGIMVDSETRAFAAALFDWRSKSAEDLATIKVRLKHVQKACDKILKAADDPSLKGKVDVAAIVNARDNAKSYLKSLKDHQDETKKKLQELEKHSKAGDRDEDD